jgi:hypothetical protein
MQFLRGVQLRFCRSPESDWASILTCACPLLPSKQLDRRLHGLVDTSPGSQSGNGSSAGEQAVETQHKAGLLSKRSDKDSGQLHNFSWITKSAGLQVI